MAHHRQQRIVLVVRMSGRFHERAGRCELPEHQPEGHVGREFTDGADSELRGE
jgi:hypothetical protein